MQNKIIISLFLYICAKGNNFVGPWSDGKPVDKSTRRQGFTSNQEDASWHAFYVMPKAERKVKDKLLLKGLEAYLPLYESIRFWSDRKKKIKIPLISGVVFVRLNPAQLSEALATPGVVNVIRYMKRPAVIRDYEIENLKILTEQTSGYDILDQPVFEEGEMVKVVQGSFYGLIAQFVRTQGKFRVVVELQALNSFIEVNVPASFLQKLTQKVA